MYSWHYIIIVQSRDLIHWGIYIRIIRLTYQRNREKGGRIGAAVACNRALARLHWFDVHNLGVFNMLGYVLSDEKAEMKKYDFTTLAK